MLFRSLQEALNNIVKHARASQVWVELSAEDTLISLTIQDNGRGLTEEKSQTSGMGLANMRERLIIAEGKLNIISNPNRGTILSAQLPLPTNRTTTQEAA